MSLRRIDSHTHIGVDPVFYMNGYYPYAQDYRNLLEQAHAFGVNRLITFPFVSYFGWEGTELQVGKPVRDYDFSVPYVFENTRMLREIYELDSDISADAIPFVIIDPSRHQQAQVDAIRKLKEQYPIYGLKIQATIIQANVSDLLADGRCFMELARENNWPMIIHSSINPADTWSQCADILSVAEAWQDVRICLAHSCRFDQPSLERVKALPNTWFDCSAHCIHCDCAVDELATVAIPERRIQADFTHPGKVMKVLYDLAPEKMMWGSDAPYYSYVDNHIGKDGEIIRLISSYAREAEALALLSEQEKDAIMYHNTLRFLGNIPV